MIAALRPDSDLVFRRRERKREKCNSLDIDNSIEIWECKSVIQLSYKFRNAALAKNKPYINSFSTYLHNMASIKWAINSKYTSMHNFQINMHRSLIIIR